MICRHKIPLNLPENKQVRPANNSTLLRRIYSPPEMKRFLILCLAGFFCPFLVCGQSAFMSFNIRYDNHNDGDDRWEKRKEAVVEMIAHYRPQLVGMQEVLFNQLTYLDGALTDYGFVGVGREDGKTKGEFAPIFYDKHRMKLLSNRTYWLSNTPDQVSVGWDAALERIATFAAFLDKQSGDTLRIFNCHYDHVGRTARKKSSELLLKIIKTQKMDSGKLLVMGDFNAEPNDPPIKILKTRLNDSYENSRKPAYGPEGTFNNFDPKRIMKARIDYIFTQKIEVLQQIHLDDRRKNNRFLSDHLPVLIRTN